MKKTINTEELLRAIQKIKEEAKGQQENAENEQMKNHGYGMEVLMKL